MSRVFDLNCPRDLLEHLQEIIAALKEDPLNIQTAMYGAIIAWSLGDWVHEEQAVQRDYCKPGDLKKAVKEECCEVGYLADLSNLLKHRNVTHYTAALRQAYRHKGSFSRGFSRGFDISGLMLVINGKEEVWLEDAMQQAFGFWTEFFQRYEL